MGSKAIVFWRHGRTAWNASGRLQGQSDVPLDQQGLAQVKAAAKALANDFPGAVVVSSNLGRAAESAAELIRELNCTPSYDSQLRERSFGEWEGLRRDEIAERWPTLFAAWQRRTGDSGTPPGGETRREVGERVALAAIEHAAALNSDQVLIVVSHGAAINAAITAMIGEDPATWDGVAGLDNANWSVLVPSRASSNYRLVGHNLGATPLRLADIFGA